jgi:hypothetical protein
MASDRKSEYAEKLKDPRWQRVRLEVMQRDGWKCIRCGEATRTLHVHHTYYLDGHNPWDYPPESLQTVCEDCHHFEYEDRPQAEQALLQSLRVLGFDSTDVKILADAFGRAKLDKYPRVEYVTTLARALSPHNLNFLVEFRLECDAEAKAKKAEQGG